MKNSEIAEIILGVATVYNVTPDETPLKEPNLTVFATSKDEVIAVIKATGGKFRKRLGYGGDSIYYESERLGGFSVHIDRSAVCRMIPARYECEPLLSPEDEAQIVEAQS